METARAQTSHAPRRRGTGQWWVIGCASIILLFVMGCIVISVLADKTQKEYERVVGGSDYQLAVTVMLEEYAQEVGEGDVADQYEEFTSRAYRSIHPVGDFETAEANVRLVANKGVSVDSIAIADQTATATMEVSQANGQSSTISFSLVREDGLWKVEDFALVTP